MSSGDERSNERQIPRYLRQMWGQPEPARRGPKPTIAIEAIGAAGVRLADAGGVDAVSMKAVGAELDMTTMSLYRYVDSKDELLMVVLDAAYGPCPVLSNRGSWRTRIEAWAQAIAVVLAQRPWIVDVPLASAPVTPNTLSWTNLGVKALSGLKLSARETMSSLLLIDGFIRQHTRQSMQLGMLRRPGSDPVPDDGMYEASILSLAGTAEFAPLIAAATEISDSDPSTFYDDELNFGLAVLLDGLARQSTSRNRKSAVSSRRTPL